MVKLGRCYKCNRITFFTKKRKALCSACHAFAAYKTVGKYPKCTTGRPHHTTYTIRQQRRKVIRKLKRCQLCGSTENLTVHHIGGSTELGLTCLCQTCHRAYEHWQQQRKQNQAQQNIITYNQ